MSSTCRSPRSGTSVTAGQSFTEVESTKSVSDIYAPVSGTVVAVNGALGDAPETLNSDPYGDGWICEIEMSDPSELDGLMDAAAYSALVGRLRARWPTSSARTAGT